MDKLVQSSAFRSGLFISRHTISGSIGVLLCTLFLWPVGANAQNTFPATGNTGIGTLSPSSLLEVNGGNVLFRGATSAVLSVSGAGTRLMWCSDRGAFRAGMVDAAEWDMANVGEYSFAGGRNSQASGRYSVAFGRNNTANDWYAFAIGYGNTASESASFAAGINSVASGYASLAFGQAALSSDDYTFAFGFATEASAPDAIALGNSAAALYPGSIALGSNAEASGHYALAGGRDTKASGDYALALGYNTGASSYASVAIGNETVASGFNAVAIGGNSTAGGIMAIVLGEYLEASGSNAMAIGSGFNQANPIVNSTNNSLVIGFNSNLPTLFVGPSSGINTFGRVGIGTSNPQSELAVKGKITCQEVEVTLSGWSDFVFRDDYPLPSLAEVEQHIAECGHLPAIPNEAEVLANGIELGEMQALLLQKIEELTLYVIEQNKVSGRQAAELRALRCENAELRNTTEELASRIQAAPAGGR